MSHRTTFRLGTRRSALAWVQSSQIAAALRAAHPGLEVELVGIDTRGDRIQDVPLSGIEGKEFFTAEIDAALIEGRVDMTVHSLKDLSLTRPETLVLAAVPRRANPRDIAIFAADVPARLAAGAGLRVGTSSPRRQQLLPSFFAQALPHASRNRIELVTLRGNVDSRLRRLHEPRGSERQLDGVVLAFAGLSRLFADVATERRGQVMLQELLRGLPLMVLPLTDVPGAPGQGALAIECRADDARTRSLLAALEHPPTRAAITFERELLARHGGGCHQRFGATHVEVPGVGGVLHVGGTDAAGRDITRNEWLPEVALLPVTRNARAWNGAAQTPPAAVTLMDPSTLYASVSAPAVFLAHSRALIRGGSTALQDRRLWTSGSASWFRLAAQGLWVEGCTEGRGAAAAADLLSEPLLRLPPLAQWDVLTHEGAEEGWNQGAWAGARALATYATPARLPGVNDGPPPDATHVFWSSIAQFERLRGGLGPEVQHASRPGKTAEHLQRAGLRHVQVFPSAEAWQQWIAGAP
ncbi:MAG: hydroxymethylbilane synthase [Steroidobacteraceae bacterium]